MSCPLLNVWMSVKFTTQGNQYSLTDAEEYLFVTNSWMKMLRYSEMFWEMHCAVLRKATALLSR